MYANMMFALLQGVNPMPIYREGTTACGGDPCGGVILVIIVFAVVYGISRNKK